MRLRLILIVIVSSPQSYRGENWNRPELPFKKLPVLVEGDFTLAESTSILRYVGQLPAAAAWYGDRTLREKVKIDEFLDFWQSTLHPTVVTLLQNKLMFKVVTHSHYFNVHPAV